MSEGYFGRIEGKFDVDAHGAATYAVTIIVPPGTAGLQPSLQLVYNSHASELGLLGAGWRLAGLSSITRVPATVAQDEFIGRVEYGANDRFALDGARLVPVEGAYGAANAVYHTEIEQWSKIVPAHSGVAGRSGPDSFTAFTKDRMRYDFGTSDDSRILANTAPGKPEASSVRTWLASRVTDRNGNTIAFRYERDPANNNAYPSSILYGGNENTGVQPQREIRFTYTPLPAGSPDGALQFIGGYPFATTRLLETISTYVSGRLVLRYRIAYSRDSVTRRSRVTSITLEDSAGRALPATTFAWQDGAPSFFGSTSSRTTALDAGGLCLPMDVNGDGIVDIVYARSDGGNLRLDLCLGTPEGTFSEAVPIAVTGLKFTPILLPLDIDADGCTDLVYGRLEGGELTMTVFHARQVGGRWTLVQGPAGGGGPRGLRGATLLPVDYDGDGRIDLIHAASEDGKLVLRPLRSDGTAFTHDPATKTVTGLTWSPAMALIPFDFDGDGKGDLAFARSDNKQLRIRLIRSDGTRLVPEPADADIGDVPFTDVLFVSDTNADGRPDLVSARLDGGTLELRTMLSNGISLERPKLSTFAVSTAAMPRLIPARLTGGLPDLVVQSIEQGILRVRVLSSNGATFVERTGVAQPFSSRWQSAMLLPADADGDGRTDLVAIGRASIDDRRLTFTTARVTGAIPDLVCGVRDGYGEQVSVEYKPLTDSTVYEKGAAAPGTSGDPRALALRGVSGATFDLKTGEATAGASHSTMNVQFAKYVVAAYERPNSGTQRFRYERLYGGARVDLCGRGWLGFARMQIIDRSRDTMRLTWYRQDFPFAGSPKTAELRRASDNRLFEQTSYVQAEVVSGKVHEARTLSKRRDVYGGPDPSTTPDLTEKTEYEYDQYGNPTLEATSVEGAKSAPLYTHHIYGDRNPAAWNLGHELEWKRTTDRAGTQILLHRRFVYDGRSNRTRDEVWESGRQRWLATEYEHDAYGNEISMKTASGAMRRTEFDPVLHTFPIRTTQPPNEARVSLITDHEHDPRNGVEILTSLPYVAGGTPRVKAKQELDGLGTVVKKLGLDPNGTLVALQMTSRGSDPTGPYEEERTLESWDGAKWRYERKYYTTSGTVFLTRSLGPDGTRETIVERTFDSDGRTLSETLLRYTGSPAQTVRRTYDSLGRLTRLERPLPAGESAVAVTRCLSSSVEESTEGFGTSTPRTTRREYGLFAGKRAIVKRVDGLLNETTYEYDALGRAVKATDPKGVVTSAAYDFSDRQILLEVRGPGGVQTSEKTEYDDAARESVRIDGRGVRVKFRYDAMQRLISRGRDQGEQTVFTYDDVSRPNTLSRLAGVSAPNGVRIAYDYDAHANRTRESITLDGTTYVTRFEYSPGARTERITFPDDSIVRHAHNAAGSLLSVDGPDGRYAEYSDFSPMGKPQKVALLNGTSELLPYNDIGQLQSQSILRKGSTDLARTKIHWNKLYQLESIADDVDPSRSQTFLYDIAGRLVHATGSYDEQRFEYDAAGNLERKGSVAFKVDGYQVRSGNLQSGAEVYRAEYDGNGNVTLTEKNGVRRDFRFDDESHLVESNGTTFLYDHEGTRVAKKSADGTKTYYVGPHYEVTVRPDGTRQTTSYIRGGQGLVASKTSSDRPVAAQLAGVPVPGLHFFHTNHINSTTLQTDARGEEVCRVEYLPFGEIYRITGSDVFRPKFTGNELDHETGLYYFKSRYYDALTGRFVSADDRLGGDVDGRDVFNRYAYVLNNPVADFDPEGHASGWAIFAGIGMGVLAVAGVAATILSGGLAAPALVAVASTLGGIVAGGAGSAAMYAFTHMDNFDARMMGIQFGIGAAVGAVGTAGSGLLMKGFGVAIDLGVAAAKISVTQIAKIAAIEAVSGFFVGALYSGLQNAANAQRFNFGEAAIRGGWSAAGGLVAGGVLGSVAREAQKPAFGPWEAARNVFAERQYVIPLSSNVYVAKATQGLLHVPRAVFGKVAGFANDATA